MQIELDESERAQEQLRKENMLLQNKIIEMEQAIYDLESN